MHRPLKRSRVARLGNRRNSGDMDRNQYRDAIGDVADEREGHATSRSSGRWRTVRTKRHYYTATRALPSSPRLNCPSFFLRRAYPRYSGTHSGEECPSRRALSNPIGRRESITFDGTTCSAYPLFSLSDARIRFMARVRHGAHTL